MPEPRKDCSQAVCDPDALAVIWMACLLDFQHGLAEALADETEAVALGGHILGQALEFLGGFEAGLLAGFDGEHFLDDGVGGGDEEVAVGGSDGRAELNGQRQGQRPGAHFEAGFVGLDDLLAGVLVEGLRQCG